jgi:hypothetical protein
LAEGSSGISLQTSGRNPVLFVAMAAVVVAALGTTLYILPAGSVTTNNGPAISASGTALNGLRFTLSIGSASIHSGGSVTINVTETNTNAKPLNISAAQNWPLQGLRMSTCYASVYPFGVAVYRGHYTSENVSAARPLNLYPIQPCPLLLRYINGYYFSPESDLARVLPGTGPAMPMDAGLVASGNYTSGSLRTPFGPGQYTVAAGDEWGSVLLLNFIVKP